MYGIVQTEKSLGSLCIPYTLQTRTSDEEERRVGVKRHPLCDSSQYFDK